MNVKPDKYTFPWFPLYLMADYTVFDKGKFIRIKGTLFVSKYEINPKMAF